MQGEPTSSRVTGLSSVSVVLAGSGGAGVMTAGNVLLEAAALSGYYALMTRSSGPQIRGGEAAAMIRIACAPVECMEGSFQVLAAVDWDNMQRFAAEIPLAGDALLVGDPARGDPPGVFTVGGTRYRGVELARIAKEITGGRANMVLLGHLAALLGLPDDALGQAAGRVLGSRAGVLEPSLAALAAGRATAVGSPAGLQLAPAPACPGGRWLLTGNEAAGLGAIKAGVRFVAAYPITPATELLEWMSAALPESGGVLVQAEDELASINMVIGSSFGGVPALTATSGPGLALMMESIGLAVAAEVPLVVIDVMRVGPSTGIPTKSEQGDLNIAIHGLHGDAPHLVLAPNGLGDCLRTTRWAVHLAEALQAPALVLSDQVLGQARAVVDRPQDPPFCAMRLTGGQPDSKDYRRYRVTPTGVSPMAIPGTPGSAYTADGLAHSEDGTPSSQAADHLAQLRKRRHKLEQHEFGELWADVEGDGELVVITFGSCTGPLREALAGARARGLALRLVSLRLLAPLQRERLEHLLADASRAVVVEQNPDGQLYRYLRSELEVEAPMDSLHKPGAQPFHPDELLDLLLQWSRT